jgi:hypothetical protein
MAAFALFFSWLALIRKGAFTLRDAGLSILFWIEEWMHSGAAVTPARLRRFHAWMNWAEWCARRADPRAARLHLRSDLRRDRSLESLWIRFLAVFRVLWTAPRTAPRRKRRGGMPRRVRARARTCAVRSLLALAPPPTPAPP